MNLNKNLEGLEPYPLVSHEAWRLDNKDQVLKLDWNEATIPPSPTVVLEVSNFILKGNLNWYPNVENNELICELAKYSEVPADYVDYFASSDALHEYIARTFVNENDVCIICSPTYDNFRVPIQSAGASVIYEWSFNQGDVTELNDILSKLSPRLVYICNPNNPTGGFTPIQQIETIVQLNPETLFVIDEAYYEFVGSSASTLCTKYSNIIISRTFSKAFALASFRIGYAIASPKLRNNIRTVRNAKSISALSQVAAIAALKSKDYTAKYVSEVIQARDTFINSLNSIGLVAYPSNANFVLVECRSELQKEHIISFLRKNRIFVRNFPSIHGNKNLFRITIGTQSQMALVFHKLRDALDS